MWLIPVVLGTRYSMYAKSGAVLAFYVFFPVKPTDTSMDLYCIETFPCCDHILEKNKKFNAYIVSDTSISFKLARCF